VGPTRLDLERLLESVFVRVGPDEPSPAGDDRVHRADRASLVVDLIQETQHGLLVRDRHVRSENIVTANAVERRGELVIPRVLCLIAMRQPELRERCVVHRGRERVRDGPSDEPDLAHLFPYSLNLGFAETWSGWRIRSSRQRRSSFI
jgi:hypothetical protein